MDRPLVGRSILIVEDEPLIALDIRRSFEAAGARVVVMRTLQTALAAVEDPDLQPPSSIMRWGKMTARNYASGSRNGTSRL